MIELLTGGTVTINLGQAILFSMLVHLFYLACDSFEDWLQMRELGLKHFTFDLDDINSVLLELSETQGNIRQAEINRFSKSAKNQLIPISRRIKHIIQTSGREEEK